MYNIFHVKKENQKNYENELLNHNRNAYNKICKKHKIRKRRQWRSCGIDQTLSTNSRLYNNINNKVLTI